MIAQPNGMKLAYKELRKRVFSNTLISAESLQIMRELAEAEGIAWSEFWKYKKVTYVSVLE